MSQSNTGVLEAQTIRVEAPAGIYRRKKNTEKETMRPRAKERLHSIETKAFSEAKSVPGVSIFAVIGTIAVSVLMVFVVLAQISYNETANESARLSAELRELTEQHRALEFAFESSFDIREVERIAKDELGMSRPDTAQILTITAIPQDSAVVVIGEEDTSAQGFAEFLKSLTDYFRS